MTDIPKPPVPSNSPSAPSDRPPRRRNNRNRGRGRRDNRPRPEGGAPREGGAAPAGDRAPSQSPQRDRNQPRDNNQPRDRNQPRDPNQSRDRNQPRDPNQSRDRNQPRDPNQVRDPNQSRDRNQGRGQAQSRDRNRRSSSKAKKFTGRISDHFSQKDFLCKCGECTQKVRISLGLVGVLEFLRFQVRKRINIVKGYQCQASHDKTGSFYKNYHIAGLAADIQIDEMTIYEVFLAAEEIPEFKGIGLNLDLNVVHLDTRKDPERTEWVVQKGKRIPLDAANRAQFIPA